MAGELARIETASTQLTVDQVISRLESVQELTRRAMIPNVDYGVIPGTGSKPTLLKAGAEKLCLLFRFAPKYRTAKTMSPDGHMTVDSTCQIISLDETFLGEATAICTTRESKYAWRRAERQCPRCGKAAIIKGKEEYGGGWLCFKKKGGCGATFGDNDASIVSQKTGRVANDDLPDSYNTVIRIAEKRAYLAAVRLVTGCSSIFDEEIPAVNEGEGHPEPSQEKTVPAKLTEPPQLDSAMKAKFDSLLVAAATVADLEAAWLATPAEYRTPELVEVAKKCKSAIIGAVKIDKAVAEGQAAIGREPNIGEFNEQYRAILELEEPLRGKLLAIYNAHAEKCRLGWDDVANGWILLPEVK
jgi:hypothetical protein